MSAFLLHPQLEADTHLIGDLPLCRVLLMNNANFPWLILVPRRMRSSSDMSAEALAKGEAVAHNYIRELFDLETQDYAQVMQEVRIVSEKFSSHTGAHKINVAALGNMVPQLHIHIIARFENDVAWPAPVWNSNAPPRPYETEEISRIIFDIRNITNL